MRLFTPLTQKIKAGTNEKSASFQKYTCRVDLIVEISKKKKTIILLQRECQLGGWSLSKRTPTVRTENLSSPPGLVDSSCSIFSFQCNVLLIVVCPFVFFSIGHYVVCPFVFFSIGHYVVCPSSICGF